MIVVALLLLLVVDSKRREILIEKIQNGETAKRKMHFFLQSTKVICTKRVRLSILSGSGIDSVNLVYRFENFGS